MMLAFDDGVADAEQLHTMRELDAHLGGCAGLLSREYFRGAGGHRVEQFVWASDDDREASTDLDEAPAAAAHFDRFDADTYYCCERVDPDGVGVSTGPGEPVSL